MERWENNNIDVLSALRMLQCHYIPVIWHYDKSE